MNIPVIDGNAIDVLPPVSTPGSSSFCAPRWIAGRVFGLPAGHRADQRLGLTPTAAHFAVLG
jgi:hypothetical protein